MQPGMNIRPLQRATSWYFLVAVTQLQKATTCFVVSVCLSVHLSAWKNMAPTGWIFMKSDTRVFLENLSRKFKKFLPTYTTYKDGTECSETSAYKIQTLQNHPKERIQHLEHGKSLKSSLKSRIKFNFH
jgi:hypothetical protein